MHCLVGRWPRSRGKKCWPQTVSHAGEQWFHGQHARKFWNPLPTSLCSPSIEVGLTFNELSLLWQLGYRKFKIVNQALNSTVRCPNPPLEGKYIDCRFDGLSSGPFGEEAPGNWMGIERMFMRYGQLSLEQRFFRSDAKLFDTAVHRLYERLHRAPVGWHAWYDVHAKAAIGDANTPMHLPRDQEQQDSIGIPVGPFREDGGLPELPQQRMEEETYSVSN